MTKPTKATPRVEAHLDQLRAAGLDTQAFFAALVGIRDDSALSAEQREALYRMIAMESFIWYLEAIQGETIDRDKAAAEAKRIADEHAAKK